MVMGFAQDGTQATMLKFNQDFTRSLFLVTNQGTQTELLKNQRLGPTHRPFDPRGQLLYGIVNPT